MNRDNHPAGIPRISLLRSWGKRRLPWAIWLPILLTLSFLEPLERVDAELSVDLLHQIRGVEPAPDSVRVVGVTKTDLRMVQDTCAQAGTGALGKCADPEFRACIAQPRIVGSELPRCFYRHLLERVLTLAPSILAVDITFAAGKLSEDPTDSEARAIAALMRESGRVVISERWRIDRRAGVELHIREALNPDIEAAAVASAPFPIPKNGGRVRDVWLFKETMGGVLSLPAVAAGLAFAENSPQFRERIMLEEREWTAEHRRQLAIVLNTMRADASQTHTAAKLSSSAAVSPKFAAMLERLSKGKDVAGIRYYGPAGTVNTLAGYELLMEEGRANHAAALNGSVVFLGFSNISDPQQEDSYSTVFTSDTGVELSGIEIAATAAANLLHGTTLTYADLTTRFAIIVIGLALANICMRYLPQIAAIGAVSALAAVYLAGAYYAFCSEGLVLPLITPIGIIAPSMLVAILYFNYVGERQRRGELTESLERFVPAPFKDQLGGGAGLVNAQRTLKGILIAVDGEGYTPFSENMSTDALRTYMNWFFGQITDIVQARDGVLTDVKADSAMGLFADSTDRPRYEDAVNAAVEILRVLSVGGGPAAPRILMPRIGLHYGEVGLGSFGSSARMEFSLFGDAANTVSRIEQLNKPLGTRILASGISSKDVPQAALRYFGKFGLKGKSAPLPVWEVVGLRSQMTAEQLKMLDRFRPVEIALATGTEPDFDMALAKYLEEYPDDNAAQSLRNIQRHLSKHMGQVF